MPFYLFDTSALAKQYHPEVGTAKVSQLLNSPGVRATISDLTVIELQSALLKKIRIGELGLDQFRRFRLQFWRDVAGRGYRVVAVEDKHKAMAVRLLLRHAPTRALRTLDALQLAVAVDLQAQGQLDYFVTADDRFSKVVRLAGITVINPEA